MTISRRSVLLNAAGMISAGTILRAQEPGPRAPEEFTLEIDAVPLDVERPIRVAATASAPTDCQVQVLTNNNQPAYPPRDWSLTPKQAFSLEARLERAAGANGYTVRAKMRPQQGAHPSMGFAITQDGGVTEDQLRQMAIEVPFIDDPAKGPGRFKVEVFEPSKIETKIWSGTIAKGSPLYTDTLSNIAKGSNPIPWDLKAKGKAGKVPAGPYLAWLTCTPNNSQRRPTHYFASFSVI